MHKTRHVHLAALVVFLASTIGATARAADECDRVCLRDIVTSYLDALVEHAPAKLATSTSVRFTENTVVMTLGDGFWRTASKPAQIRPGVEPYRLDVLDPTLSTAVTYAVLEEDGEPVLHVARLKAVDRKITEIETMVVRSQPDGGGIFAPEMLVHPSDTMTHVPAAADLASREAAIAIAEHYPAGLRVGSFAAVDAPFTASAYRLENGRLMAGPGCTFAQSCGDIKTQRIPTLPTLRSTE